MFVFCFRDCQTIYLRFFLQIDDVRVTKTDFLHRFHIIGEMMCTVGFGVEENTNISSAFHRFSKPIQDGRVRQMIFERVFMIVDGVFVKIEEFFRFLYFHSRSLVHF